MSLSTRLHATAAQDVKRKASGAVAKRVREWPVQCSANFLLPNFQFFLSHIPHYYVHLKVSFVLSITVIVITFLFSYTLAPPAARGGPAHAKRGRAEA